MGIRAVASRQLEISECLKNFGPMREKIQELIDFESSKIDQFADSAVHEADRDDLNSHIIQRQAFKRVLLLVTELKEDLHPNEESSDSDE